MTWIIWCDYIFYFDYSCSHIIFYKLSNSGLSQKRWLFSFSIIYSFLQLNFRLMNHYIFFITLFWVNIQFYVCFLVLHHRPSLPLIAFVWFLFDIIFSYFESVKLEFILKHNLAMYLNVFVNYLSNIRSNFVLSFDYHHILFKKWEIWIIYLKLKKKKN